MPKRRDLLLKIVGQVVRPVVVTQPQPTGHAFADAPEAFADALADRLQGLEAVPALGGMEPDACGRAVIDGHEDEGRPLGDRHGGRHVCAPHHVGRLGGDGPVVRLRPDARGPRAAGLGGRARASTGAPAPSRCASPRPAASPRLFGSPRHETARLRAPGECGPPGRRPGQRRSARGDDTVQETVSPADTRIRHLERARCHTRQTRCTPYARRVEIDWAPLIASTSAGPKGRRPPAGPPSRTALTRVSIQQLADLGLQPTHGLRHRASGARLFRPACPAARNFVARHVRRPRAPLITHRPQTRTRGIYSPRNMTHHYLTLAPGREPTPTDSRAGEPRRSPPDVLNVGFLISTLLLRELSRNQVSKKTLGRQDNSAAFVRVCGKTFRSESPEAEAPVADGELRIDR